jgi:hypothetical protein
MSAGCRTTSLKGLTDDIIGISIAILVSYPTLALDFTSLDIPEHYQNFLVGFVSSADCVNEYTLFIPLRYSSNRCSP